MIVQNLFRKDKIMFGKHESKSKSQQQIAQEQAARKANRAPLYEVMEVPEEERTESENEWVKSFTEGRQEWMRRKMGNER
jgi:hypothetical protein